MKAKTEITTGAADALPTATPPHPLPTTGGSYVVTGGVLERIADVDAAPADASKKEA